MLRFTLLIATLLVKVTHACLFGSTGTSRVCGQGGPSNNGTFECEHMGISIFQTSLVRIYQETGKLLHLEDKDGKLSTQWNLRDYFANSDCVCKCTKAKYPGIQKYSELNKRSADPHSQFINKAQWHRYVDGMDGRANWVDSFSKRDGFIACRAPMNGREVYRFWKMAWQNRARVIVMLTKPVENGIHRSFRYWPRVVNARKSIRLYIGWTLLYYNVTLTAIDIDHAGGYECSRLEVTNGHDVRVVTHCLFTEWPDMSVPHSAHQFVAFRRHVKGLTTAVTDKSPSPVIVHCYAGLGRTGTYIAIDVLIDRMENDPKMPVDVAGVVERLRVQRPNSILCEMQYEFCAAALQAHYCTSDSHTC